MEKCKTCGSEPVSRVHGRTGGIKKFYFKCETESCWAGPSMLSMADAELVWNKLMRVEPAPVVKDDNTARAPLHMCATNTSICVHEINKWHHQRE